MPTLWGGPRFSRFSRELGEVFLSLVEWEAAALTDGIVPASEARRIAGSVETLDRVVTLGIASPVRGGYRIHRPAGTLLVVYSGRDKPAKWTAPQLGFAFPGDPPRPRCVTRDASREKKADDEQGLSRAPVLPSLRVIEGGRAK